MGFDETPPERANAEPDETANAAPRPQPKPQPKQKPFALARLLLFLLLLAALGTLGYDLLAKRKLNQAFATMERLNGEQEEIVGKMGVDDKKVRSELGREPNFIDTTSNQRGERLTVEHYEFGGVFYRYMLNVYYYTKTGYMDHFEQVPVFRIGGQ